MVTPVVRYFDVVTDIIDITWSPLWSDILMLQPILSILRGQSIGVKLQTRDLDAAAGSEILANFSMDFSLDRLDCVTLCRRCTVSNSQAEE